MRSAFKFTLSVVDVRTNGAVPVGTFDVTTPLTNSGPEIVAAIIADAVSTDITPDLSSLDSFMLC